MARTLSESKSEEKKARGSKKADRVDKGEPIEVANRSNLVGHDPAQLRADVQRVIGLAAEASEAHEPVSTEKKTLKSERGYHMGAFATCLKIERMEDPEARDWWMTMKAYADARGLTSPDMVDIMEAAE